MPKIFIFQKMKSREHQCGRGTFWHRIITYKSLTGDYSHPLLSYLPSFIITYKSLTGDYSEGQLEFTRVSIITYKSLTGDYSE